ncbi:hypothetical protein G7067_01310 [Leucobacter insecticola]|uniref:Uncharacterized protein n=1 Tax=Leucobacter insecticola TaxID=2714934 RepID=A0A6G8FG91_9MICO|nr:hypothetical protein [Leucobacter insecticola]QIM15355.1 hypothetical protein G7067_01310 [Leucobacter insecticola]
MPSRFDAALRLDITLEMARKHGIPAQISQADLDELDRNPPPWLTQSRANRTGKRAVWTTLTCALCDYTEHERPKKWWPEFTSLICDAHEILDFPAPAAGTERSFTYGVGSRFTGLTDS